MKNKFDKKIELINYFNTCPIPYKNYFDEKDENSIQFVDLNNNNYAICTLFKKFKNR